MKNGLCETELRDLRLKPTPYRKIEAHLRKYPKLTVAKLATKIGIEAQHFYQWRANQNRKKPKIPKTGFWSDQPCFNPRKPTKGSKDRYTAEEKFSIVMAYNRGGDRKKGEILRKYGLYSTDIERWSDLIQEVVLDNLSRRKPRKDKESEESKQIKSLEKEVLDSQATIAKLSAIIVAQKKISDLLNRGS
jgi:transposase-like protein